MKELERIIHNSLPENSANEEMKSNLTVFNYVIIEFLSN